MLGSKLAMLVKDPRKTPTLFIFVSDIGYKILILRINQSLEIKHDIWCWGFQKLVAREPMIKLMRVIGGTLIYFSRRIYRQILNQQIRH